MSLEAWEVYEADNAPEWIDIVEDAATTKDKVSGDDLIAFIQKLSGVKLNL